MKFYLLAATTLALVSGAAVAQPPGHDGRGPGGHGGFGLLEMDANADGKLTKAEFDAAQRTRFTAIDANKDGSATREEAQAHRQAAMETHRAEAATARFTALDTDKNGQISQAEFAAGKPDGGKDGGRGMRGGHGPRGAGGPPPMAGGPRAGGPAGAPADGRAGPADADSDGKVTFAEFSARALEAFNRADTNKDGTVTIAEIQASKPGRP